MARVSWTTAARADLREIRRYIAQDSRDAATRISNRILHATRRLATFPASGRIVPEAEREDVRELIVEPYRVIYGVLGGTVRVLMIRHSAQQFDIAELFSRM